MLRAMQEVLEALGPPLMAQEDSLAEQVAKQMTELWMDLPSADGEEPPSREKLGTVPTLCLLANNSIWRADSFNFHSYPQF